MRGRPLPGKPGPFAVRQEEVFTPSGWGLASVATSQFRARGQDFHLETHKNHRISEWSGPVEIYLFMQQTFTELLLDACRC